MKLLEILAAIALVPAMVGPLPAAAGGIVVPLCGGGSMTMPTPPSGPPDSSPSPCCAKGCRSGASRKRIDRAQ